MIIFLDDTSHERLWRICDALVSASGARAAMVCDAESGSVLVSVGDASSQGAPTGVEALGPGERLVHGEGGQIYGVDIPGGAMLAVLHEVTMLDRVRAAAARAVAEAADLIANLPPPPPVAAPQPHTHERAAKPKRPRKATGKSKAPARKSAKKKPIKKVAARSKRRR